MVPSPRSQLLSAPGAAAPGPAAGRRIDWSTVFMLLPSRRFTAEELRRAIPGPMSPSVKVSIAFNLAVPALALLIAFGRDAPWVVPATMLAFVALLAWIGLRAWADPSSSVPRTGYWMLPLLSGLVGGWLLKGPEVTRAAAVAIAMMMVIGSLGLWFVIVHRHQYVQMRLAELAERERAVEMARRLAAAQLEPHFLFNTLASLQHWVATRDERAAPLLEALTGYLRATLPMFALPTLALADEAEAVRRYLQVMQARLGARLAWRVEIDPRLQALAVPPGLLLTLVENAVEHGIEPQIGGGEVSLRAAVQEGGERAEAVVAVEDSGAGPAADAHEGLGLTNARERLAFTHGTAARLTIARSPAGGCRAELRLPMPVAQELAEKMPAP
ncbi:MAG: histidine kinase [Burkholderiales bacterium]|nr:histidine kinase [Burkholderiales bacterium]